MDATEAERFEDVPRANPSTLRESVAGVLGVGVGLLVIVAIAGMLLVGRVRELEDKGQALLDETFASVAPLPWGFGAVRATRLADKKSLILFADPDQPLPEPPVIDPREDGWGGGGRGGGMGGGGRGGRGRGRPGGSGQGGGRAGSSDNAWSKLEELEHAVPIEATLVWYPLAKADAVISRQFGGVNFKDIGQLGQDGDVVPVDSGHLDWRGFEAPFVRLRDYHKANGEHTFHDTLRVNLSIGDKPCVLYLRWADRVPGASADAEAFLEALEPRR